MVYMDLRQGGASICARVRAGEIAEGQLGSGEDNNITKFEFKPKNLLLSTYVKLLCILQDLCLSTRGPIVCM
jgi:hypothetical protein